MNLQILLQYFTFYMTYSVKTYKNIRFTNAYIQSINLRKIFLLSFGFYRKWTLSEIILITHDYVLYYLFLVSPHQISYQLILNVEEAAIL